MGATSSVKALPGWQTSTGSSTEENPQRSSEKHECDEDRWSPYSSMNHELFACDTEDKDIWPQEEMSIGSGSFHGIAEGSLLVVALKEIRRLHL